MIKQVYLLKYKYTNIIPEIKKNIHLQKLFKIKFKSLKYHLKSLKYLFYPQNTNRVYIFSMPDENIQYF